MPETNEEKFDTGLAALEMTRSPGWQWLEEKITSELKIENNELRNFDLTGLGVEQVAAEYLRHRANLNAYENLLAMVKTAIEEKEDAAQAMRN